MVKQIKKENKKDNKLKTKSKTVAVVLAVLVGIFGWIYTWRDDQWKFWTNLVIHFFTLYAFGYPFWGIVSLVWVIVDTASKPKEYYENYYVVKD